MNVLMVGVSEETKGGMWTVVENYLEDEEFIQRTNLIYIATAGLGSIPHRLWMTLKAYIRILFVLLTKKIDIIHVHMAEKGSVFRKGIVIRMGRVFGCKIVCHLHGATFEVWYKECSERKQKLIKKILDQSDKVIILGEYWLDFIGQLIRKEKICVVYNAVKELERNPYSMDNKDLLFLGALNQRKGIDDLLSAMKIVKESKCFKGKLYLYGPDSENKIEKKIEENNLTDVVEYKGWLNNQDKQGVFNTIAVNILPSYNEGLPMTILETMSYGIPNISTNVAAIPEAITNHENGILIEPGVTGQIADAVISMVSDDSKRSFYSQSAFLRIAKEFSLDIHRNKILTIYNELMGGKELLFEK
ncbi:glycosyltransferase family 4 protein [Anaerocolumna xylanovorans]|uniref:Glycosyltransferase involved in cell wall bisynthesis n=1 Tax=Anaerocolumna xylanovorans DSM 12503 TaxID=1121345 RepID=A0A1M7YA73_9FIRM|nr:glycosyltransferase family 4 protein [Anaerocolumna xylanovorans]SHO49520.1 Glycosyltransferase involved in cell wall bisynthesis [Anaerocolumna xylanovorans DSM 12503]